MAKIVRTRRGPRCMSGGKFVKSSRCGLKKRSGGRKKRGGLRGVECIGGKASFTWYSNEKGRFVKRGTKGAVRHHKSVKC